MKNGIMEPVITSTDQSLATEHGMKDTTAVSGESQPVGGIDLMNGHNDATIVENTIQQSSPPTSNGLSPKQSDRSSGDVPASHTQSQVSPSGLAPTVLQHLQQTMQQQLSPQQLQQLVQQQSLLMSHQQHPGKFHEQMITQLNEQLQVNMLQQSQLLQQGAKNKNNKQLHQQLQQLSTQQQQLVQQIQLLQRQFLMSQRLGIIPSFGAVHHGMSQGELQQLWKEVTAQKYDDSKAILNGINLPSTPVTPSQSFLSNGVTGDGFIMPGPMLVGVGDDPSGPHPLYAHSVCRWPGCDKHCDDYSIFIQHLNTEHQLDDRSTAQARVQMQVVSQLELQLAKERDRLQAMMQHLHMSQQRAAAEATLAETFRREATSSFGSTPLHKKLSPTNHHTPSSPLSRTTHDSVPTLLIQNSPTGQSHVPLHQSGMPGPIRRRVSDKSNLPVSAEIHRNREFYKNTDIRPPFTYASLIRQGIMESTHKQLTLNEIYQWFQNTFAYFRRNEATWKNAVRHNLSLHKCFMRVENVKGAVWTVDEDEFYKRRPQKLSGNKSLPMRYDGLSPQSLANGQYMAGQMDLDVAEDLSLKAQYLSNMSDENLLQDEALIAEIKREVIEELTGINQSDSAPNSPEMTPVYGGTSPHEPVDLSPRQSSEPLSIPHPSFIAPGLSTASDVKENNQDPHSHYGIVAENSAQSQDVSHIPKYSSAHGPMENHQDSAIFAGITENSENSNHYTMENHVESSYLNIKENLRDSSQYAVDNCRDSAYSNAMEISQEIARSPRDDTSPTNMSASDYSYRVISHTLVT